MSLPTKDPRPPYLLAADAIRREIAAGRIKPGERVPSYRELEERFGIANMTARSALRVLREEGLIYTVQGRGSFVTDSPPATERRAGEVPPQSPSAAEEHDRHAGIATASITETLVAIRDQLRNMNADMQDLKQQVSDLRDEVQRREQKDGR